jgi:K+ transporter
MRSCPYQQPCVSEINAHLFRSQSPWRNAWHSTLETAFPAERGFVSGICLTHHLRHNRVLYERVLFIASVSVDAPRIEAANRIKLVPVGAGITRVHLD